METIELFSGTASFSKVALQRGFKINTYDIADHAVELLPNTHTQCDVLDRTVSYPENIDYAWFSPPCNAFSVASISHHWGGGKGKYIPKTDATRLGLKILDRTIELIATLKPTTWWLENPRGVMRKVIDECFLKHGITDYVRHTVTYCSYSKLEKRMKPTDIWTSDKLWQPRKPCKNYRYDSDGNVIDRHCHHEMARRGARTGTQGAKGAIDRAIIPKELFEEIFNSHNTNTIEQ